ncbi:MAG: FAD-dependent oxidoreductase, partial [Rhizobiales bacterium]|nr:FAD-dependent oxidoreductase [Hyphomicrobiales bacterium]
GEADMVGMTRAHIADPDIVKKVKENRLDDIRPCVGANLCISNATEAKTVRCMHNPEAARELDWGPQTAAGKAKRVAVIGGGPAGLEAARVAAERGHQVVLYEAGAELGGQFRLWAKAPQTKEFARSLDWFERQLTKLQVQVRRNTAVAPGDLADLEFDNVILATGSTPAAPPALPGLEDANIQASSPWEILEQPPSGQHILIVDEGGGRAGLSAADMALENNRITVVSTDFTVGEMVNPNIRTPLYKRFLSGGAVFRPCEEVVRAEGSTIVTRNIYSAKEQKVEDVDVLVNWRGNQVVNELAEALEARDLPLKVIGDCRAPRHLHTAFAEGALAGRSV